MADDNETYILLLLADSNLPTGSFVASSGLESYVKHGFTSSLDSTTVVAFVRDSLATYARSALPFVSDAHRIVTEFKSESGNSISVGDSGGNGSSDEACLRNLTALDELYDTMTLNHVARRASKSQGVALLTLYSKGLSCPSSLSGYSVAEPQEKEIRIGHLLERFKLLVRKEEVHGHLTTCWGALTAVLGLTLERSQYLHLFLHARSLLSASVRLNDIGPYGAQQILLHTVRPLVAGEARRSQHLRTGLLETQGDDFDETTQGPANKWPLGEILSARHDLQHSRIFNS